MRDDIANRRRDAEPQDTGRRGVPEFSSSTRNASATRVRVSSTRKVPGIEYMLAGATQRSDSDPFDKTDPPIKIGPHWMILWPFDPKTSGLPTVHKATGAYIMYAGTPWAHVHVMGAP